MVDLPRSLLRLTAENRVYFDVNAAGYGWFIDGTPAGDGEFTVSVADTELQAEGASAAADLAGSPNEHNLMFGTIGLGTRRFPAEGLARGNGVDPTW